MTTGVVSVTGATNKDYSYSKTWTGGDGKYDLVTGKEKWNDYSMNRFTMSDQLGQTTYAATTSLPDYAWKASDELRLQSKLVTAIKGHQFNLAVDLAQANQLVSMCSNTIRSLGRSFLYLKRGNVSAALRELGVDGKNKKLKSKDVSSRWLEIQYGWLPSISSAYEASKAFEALSLDRSGRVQAKVTRVYESELSASPSLYTFPAVNIVSKRIVAVLEEEVSFARSLGLLDPLQVAWEVIPYSFVFDWFLPIGTYLENLSVIPTLKAKFLSTTYLRCDAAFGAAINPAWSGTRRRWHSMKLTRVQSSSLNTQRPTFVDPVAAMTSKRIANAVSLAHQLIAR